MSDMTGNEINPIADLSYRNYDGPLRPPVFRWWTIARQTIRMAAKNKWVWIMSALAGAYYAIIVIEMFVFDRIAQNGPGGTAARDALLGRIHWNDQFLHGIGYAQMPSMILALIVGAGAIANDNRANALLVYLSKPCTRFDYAFGKWIGVFLVLVAALGLPSIGFYLYGALSFRDQGFLQDRSLLPRLFLLVPLCAALNTSLVLAISSLFKQGRLAGAVYAGIYYLGYFFTQVMNVVWITSHLHLGRHGRPVVAHNDPPLVGTLFYTSVDGLQIGLAKAILRTRGGGNFGMPSPPRTPLPPPAPPLVPCLLILSLITVVSIAIAWRRVRAVEVVG